MSKTRTVLVAALVALAAGCASTGAARPGGSADKNSNLITADQIRDSGASDAFQAVQRLRPLWLRDRGDRSKRLGTTILVYLDGSRMGGPDALRSLLTDGITSIRYLDSAAAQSELPSMGMGHVQGAIVVSTSGTPR